MKSDIQRHLYGIYSVLRSRINLINKSIGHTSTQGSENENEVKKLLLDFLPSNYGIGSGIIIGTDGKQSKQVDIIIYDKSRPDYSLSSSSKIFLADHVIAAIEIKTTYTSGESSALSQALENIVSVKSLAVSERPWIDGAFNPDEKAFSVKVRRGTPPLGIVFFFGGQERNTPINIHEFVRSFRGILDKVPTELQPDLLFSLQHAFFFKYPDISDRRKGKQSLLFSLVQIEGNSNQAVDVSGMNDRSVGAAHFGEVVFKEGSFIPSAILPQDSSKSHIHVAAGPELSLEPIVYRAAIAGKKHFLLDQFGAFINFVMLIEKLLSVRKMNSAWSPEDYFQEGFLKAFNYEKYFTVGDPDILDS